MLLIVEDQYTKQVFIFLIFFFENQACQNQDKLQNSKNIVKKLWERFLLSISYTFLPQNFFLRILVFRPASSKLGQNGKFKYPQWAQIGTNIHETWHTYVSTDNEHNAPYFVNLFDQKTSLPKFLFLLRFSRKLAQIK